MTTTDAPLHLLFSQHDAANARLCHAVSTGYGERTMEEGRGQHTPRLAMATVSLGHPRSTFFFFLFFFSLRSGVSARAEGAERFSTRSASQAAVCTCGTETERPAAPPYLSVWHVTGSERAFTRRNRETLVGSTRSGDRRRSGGSRVSRRDGDGEPVRT